MSILGMTCQRDDGPFLLEWIAHHLAAGVDHMLILSHDCSDGSDHLLDLLEQSGRVTHVRFAPKGRKSVQWQALQIMANHPLYREADWAIFFDCDEFMSVSGGRIDHLLAHFASGAGTFDAVALPWRFFGADGQERRSGAMTPERFTKAAPRDLHFPLAHLFKTLHRPGAFQKPGVHRPRAKKAKPARWLGPDGRALPASFAAQDGAISLYGMPIGTRQVELNHYSLRSLEEFIVKRARGLPNHQSREIDVAYWAERNWNSEAAPLIGQMLPATQAELIGLMALEGAAQAMADCLSWHRTQYEALMQDIDVLRMHFRLGLLTGSTPPEAEAGRAFVEAQRAILAEKAARK